jgi:catechol 2,3-dioxygenase-like lactoylglutathione lyase family enzyme
MAKPNPIPEGYTTVTPSLIFRDAPKAIEFYKKALGAQERMVMKGPDGKVGHAEILIGGSIVMLMDEAMGFRSAESIGASPVFRVHMERRLAHQGPHTGGDEEGPGRVHEADGGREVSQSAASPKSCFDLAPRRGADRRGASIFTARRRQAAGPLRLPGPRVFVESIEERPCGPARPEATG